VEFHNEIQSAGVRIDPERIRIVLRNLLDNAIKYAGTDAGRIVTRLMETDHYFVIKISNRGPGIPERDIPNIFEPFYRADRSRSKTAGGYGLGLSLSKKIIQAHGGEIDIKNNEKQGVTATVKLKR
jgi:signal transduction histidine kinase